MISPLEPLFCPCCTPAILHAISQYGSQVLAQPLLLLGSGSLLSAVGVNPTPPPTNPEASESELLELVSE
ncbi:MAG: hypothetical protein KME17_18965 [Cyanosarcina radialis HA8281-LM2]|nr:hypothetical protein [Cyanosarcina radialis HA8281-LM2]